MLVSAWMTSAPHCVRLDDLLADVASAMQQGRFRQAPVVDAAGKLIGIITQRDLREHKGYLEVTRVSAAMVEPAIAVSPQDSLEAAARILLERKIGGLPVVDAEHRVVGVLTTSDLLRGMLDSFGGAAAVRLDLRLDELGHSLAEAMRILEAAGISVLSLGTFAADRGEPLRVYLRVPAPCAERAAAALRAAGLGPLAAERRNDPRRAR